MSLDTISQVLKAECCWIQTIGTGKKRLSLVASRGLNPEMESEIKALEMDHDFTEIIVGTGQKIVIPDLSNDGMYGLSSFNKAGFRWLVAVPLMTYRALGLMGIASRHKKNYQKETPDLALVIGGLVATAINKADLFQMSLGTQKPPRQLKKDIKTGAVSPAKKSLEHKETKVDSVPSPDKGHAPADNGFHVHARKMESFRRSHPG